MCDRKVRANAHSSRNYDSNSTTIYLWSRKLPANGSFSSRRSGSRGHSSCRNLTESRLPADFVPTGAGAGPEEAADDVLGLFETLPGRDHEVEYQGDPGQCSPQAHALAVPVFDVVEQDDQVDVAVGAGGAGGCRPKTITSAGRAAAVRRATISSRSCWSASTTRIMALTSSSFQVGARSAGAPQLLPHADLDDWRKEVAWTFVTGARVAGDVPRGTARTKQCADELASVARAVAADLEPAFVSHGRCLCQHLQRPPGGRRPVPIRDS